MSTHRFWAPLSLSLFFKDWTLLGLKTFSLLRETWTQLFSLIVSLCFSLVKKSQKERTETTLFSSSCNSPSLFLRSICDPFLCFHYCSLVFVAFELQLWVKKSSWRSRYSFTPLCLILCFIWTQMYLIFSKVICLPCLSLYFKQALLFLNISLYSVLLFGLSVHAEMCSQSEHTLWWMQAESEENLTENWWYAPFC